MASSHSTRRSADSSLSPPPDQEPVLGGDQFHDLSRRLLVAVSHVQLVAQHFGDLSGLDAEDTPAGLTLYQAAQDLDALYNDIDTWYVRHEHRPKARRQTVADSDGSEEAAGEGEAGCTEGQRLYGEITAREEQLKSLLSDIPYETLGDDPATCRWLDGVDTHLEDAVAQLRKVLNVEVPRYERQKAGEEGKS